MKRHYLYALFCFLLMNISGWAVVYTFDFENAEDNAHWHFVNGSETNQWNINTSAGSCGTGSNSLTINDFTYYKNEGSVVWAYCDIPLSGETTISFDWKGLSGSSVYDGMLYIYLVPVSATTPKAGSNGKPTNSLSGGVLNSPKSSWSKYNVIRPSLPDSISYYLYLMWWNIGYSATTRATSIAIDNVIINTGKFKIRNSNITQSKIHLETWYKTFSTTLEKIGYAYNGDTTWMPNTTTNYIVCDIDSLHALSTHTITFLAKDTINMAKETVLYDNCPSLPYENGWSSNDSAWGWNKLSVGYYTLGHNQDSWLYKPIYLKAGKTYKVSYYSNYYQLLGDFNIAIGTSPDSTSMEVLTDMEVLTENRNRIFNYTPQKTGTYYIGLHGVTTEDTDISITDINVYIPAHRELGFLSYDTIVTTKGAEMSIQEMGKTQGSIRMKVKYDTGDALQEDSLQFFERGVECKSNSVLIGSSTQSFTFDNNTFELDTIFDSFCNYGLVPETKYKFLTYYIDNNRITHYEDTLEVTTLPMTYSVTCDATQKSMQLHFTYNSGDARPLCTYLRWKKASQSYWNSIIFREDTISQNTHDTIISGLQPDTKYKVECEFYFPPLNYITNEYDFTTLPITLNNPTNAQYGQTYVQLESNCDYGDATLLKNLMQLGTTSYSVDTTIEVTNNVVKITDLVPNKKYYYRNVIETMEAGTMQSEWQDFTTKKITLSTQDADGISNTSVYLHGTVDCDQESYTEVGFEWKRSDAPSTVNPQRLLVTDRTDENLIFRLEGLSPDRYYDFRAFCMYQGKTYYGAWVGFLTADKEVVIAPTVETLGATANEKGVEMRGKVVSGTEPILQQGFESWIKGSTTVATTVAEGKTMTAYIPEPWAYETYQYRAYAKTASGTTYGETLEVTTGYIEREIADVEITPSTNSAEVTWAAIEVADYYILTLFRDKEMSDTLAIYEVSPSGKVKQVRKPTAKIETITCTIEDLYQNTTYYFAVQAYNDEDQMIAEEIGSFTTLKEEMGMQDAEAGSEAGVQKVLHNGQVLIIRNGKVYTAMGVALE